MSATLGIDQNEFNGIPLDIEAMHKAFPFGWYQISNGLTLGIMSRKAWPVYARHYGGYHFFNPNPDGNWIVQSMTDYAEACAWLFLDSMKGDFGRCPPRIDFDPSSVLDKNYLNILFPDLTPSKQAQKGYLLSFQMLKIILEIVEQATKQIPVLCIGNNFWLFVNGQNQTWASRYPLMIAIHPFDGLVKESEILAGIQTVMAGTNTLPAIQIPPPWTSATYIQFTRMYPTTEVPGYPKEANWAKEVSLSLQVSKETHRSKRPVGPARTRVMNNLFSSDHILNVRTDADEKSQLLGNLPAGSIVAVDKTKGEYSHFVPTSQFPVGGWIFTAFLMKVAA